MTNYSPNDFTWGYEIEWGDIDRRIHIPEQLGTWEYAETDIVNIHEPFKYVACDPLGESPYMGGEVNTKPTHTWKEQVDRIMEVHQLFVDHGNQPSASCVNHGHLHVHVPGLTDDLDALKRLIEYIHQNQHRTIQSCYQFADSSDMSLCKGAKSYLKYDGGRPMPSYMCQNIISLATHFDHFIQLHAAGKDGVSLGRPFRYAINTYCLKHTGTIEFRCFRSSVHREEIASQFRFVTKFLDAALNAGPPVEEIFSTDEFMFPKFVWNREEYVGWIASKYEKSRGQKRRQYYDVA